MWPKLNTMKPFVTLVACLASFIGLAQNPNYDPDSNGDNLIGAEDLQSFLAVYNTILTSEQATIGYVTDFDSIGSLDMIGFEALTIYAVPDSVDVVLWPPEPLYANSRAALDLNTTNKTVLTVEGGSLGVAFSVLENRYVQLHRSPAYPTLRTWVSLDGRWYNK